jgi:hypothetical protein
MTAVVGVPVGRGLGERFSMRQRALIHIDGPPGAGKTTLIEALLARTDYMITAVRCVRDDTLPEPCESLVTTAPELHRYRVGGARTPARYVFPGTSDVFPGTSDAHDAFFQTNVMQDFSHAVVIEGDCPVSFADVTAFVAPAAGRQLLVRRESDQPSREREAIDAFEAVLSRPGGLESILGELVGPGVGDFAAKLPDLMEQERQKTLAQLAELRSRPATKPLMRWAVADPYRGIERAQLVVVNIRDHTEQDTGEALLAEVARLRNDHEIFTDVKGPRGNRIPITAVVANLTQPTDPGTKKALTRIRRVIRANS